MSIYEKLHIPSAAKIDRMVAKKQFYDNADLSSADKKLFDHAEKIYWRYALKTDNTNIPSFADAEREYTEIEVMEVLLREEKSLVRLAELIFRAIPYPMLLFFLSGEKAALWLGKLRKNQADGSRMILTETEHTDFLTEDAPLWEMLSLKKSNTANFCALYEGLYDTVSRSRLTAHDIDAAVLSGEEARATLTELAQIEQEIESLRSRMKKESQFNRKMELNIKLQTLKKERAKILGQGSIEA